MSSINDKLKRLGFTEYEAKIYIALLGSQPVNGNEIANLSGVPGAKVYGCLQVMAEKGYVSAVYEEGATKPRAKYMAAPYEQLLENHFQSMVQDIGFLKEELKKVHDKRPENILKQELYQIVDFDLTFKTIKDLINNSEKSIYICCWKEHEKIIQRELLSAFKRGVRIVVLLFNDDNEPAPWQQFDHLSLAVVEKRHKDEINIVVDEKSVLISKLTDSNVFTVVSDNIALIQTTLNYIRHDIYVNRVLYDFYEEAAEKYGAEFQDLLNI